MSLFINRVVQGKNKFEFAGEVSALSVGAEIYYCSCCYYSRFTNEFGSRCSARCVLCRAAKGGERRAPGRRRRRALPRSSPGTGASGRRPKAMRIFFFFLAEITPARNN